MARDLERTETRNREHTVPSGGNLILLLLLYLLAEVTPFALLFLFGWIAVSGIPALEAMLSDREFVIALIPLSAMVLTFVFLFNHGFWSAFFRALLSR
jgi:hypothetical protein